MRLNFLIRDEGKRQNGPTMTELDCTSLNTSFFPRNEENFVGLLACKVTEVN